MLTSAQNDSNMNASIGVAGTGVKENTKQELHDRLNEIKMRLGKIKK